MKINLVTLFPEMFDSFLSHSIMKRAIEKGALQIDFYNFRNFSTNKNHSVDDTSYGGGAGMVIGVEPVHKCLKSIKEPGKIIALTPTGTILTDEKASELAKCQALTIVCGHYEGFDERVYQYVDEELSIGDYVLTGGETAAYVVLDAVSRKLPGVINKESYENDSFSNGIFDYPVYTKPLEYDGIVVPDILLSGNHQRIAEWRYEKALKKTYLRRKDLIEKHIDLIDLEVLKKIIASEEE